MVSPVPPGPRTGAAQHGATPRSWMLTIGRADLDRRPGRWIMPVSLETLMKLRRDSEGRTFGSNWQAGLRTGTLATSGRHLCNRSRGAAGVRGELVRSQARVIQEEHW
jgi:hypothetical protein